MTLQRALLLLLTAAFLAGIVPAGLLLDRRLVAELENRAREDLTLAPRILAARTEGIAESMVMHAKDVARAPGLAEALLAGDRVGALRLLEAARDSFGTSAVLIDSTGRRWAGPVSDPSLLASTRVDSTPVGIVFDGDAGYNVALAPVRRGDVWVGAAGVAVAIDSAAAAMLAGLTHSDVVILGPRGTPVAFSADSGIVTSLAAAVLAVPDAGGEQGPGRVVKVVASGVPYFAVRTPMGGGASMIFARPLSRDLAVVPDFRRVLAFAGLGALALALVLGTLLSARLAHPVSSLADAADRLAKGDFDAPLAPSSLRDVHRLGQAFDAMRRTLRGRLDELGAANQTLAERQERLMSLQAELIHRERQSASSRLVAELAHEIRNPVANLRNCLELIHRRVEHDEEALEFTNLAIDELLRMHELAERMLDLNRPSGVIGGSCDPVAVARDVVALARIGLPAQALAVTITCPEDVRAAIAPDMLKQVLLNLVQNAREAKPEGLEVGIDVHCSPDHVLIGVVDNGPGIAPDVLQRMFDPFFTTKGTAGGIGLGLFLAEGIIRKRGGRIIAANRPGGSGARFSIEIPREPVQATEAPALEDPRTGVR